MEYLEYIQYIGLLQWGIVLLSCVLCFIRGLSRGTYKSLYYSLVNILLMVVLLVVLGNLSLRFFVSMQELLDFTKYALNNFDGTSNIIDTITQYEGYLLEPDVSIFAFAVIDLVLRIVAILILYPILKVILKYIIFVPIYKLAVRPAIIKRQNKKMNTYLQIPSDAKYRKKVKKTFGNRMIGGMIGGFKGIITGFVFVIPLVVLTGLSANINLDTASVPSYSETGTNEETPAFEIPDEVFEIVEYLKIANSQGLRIVTDNVKFGDTPVDKVIFNGYLDTTIATVSSNNDREDVNLSLFSEIESIVDIACLVYNSGYLTQEFFDSGYMDISKDDIELITAMFEKLSSLTLITELIPAATKVAIPLLLEMEEIPIDVNLYDIEQTKIALDYFTDIDFEEEIREIGVIMTALLEIGSIGEWSDMFSFMAVSGDEIIFDIDALTQLSENMLLISDVIKKVGNLDIMSLTNIGLYFMSADENILSMISWLSDDSDKIDYLLDYYDEIYRNPKYFIGEGSAFHSLADIISLLEDETLALSVYEAIESENYGSLDLSEYDQFVRSFVSEILEMNFLMKSIPLVFDISVYQTEDLDEDIRDELLTMVEDADFKEEIASVSDIYKNISKISLDLLFESDYPGFTDYLLKNFTGELREIVDIVLVDSHLVNQTLEILHEPLLDVLIDDDELRNLILDAVSDETGLTFSFGKEFKDILYIADILYEKLTLTEILSIDLSNINTLLSLADKFGSYDELTFGELAGLISSLQTVNRLDSNAINYAKNNFLADMEMPFDVYIPELLMLSRDINAILNIFYHACHHLSDAKMINPDLEYADLNLSGLFSDEHFRQYLVPASGSDIHSELLLYNIISFITNIYDVEGLEMIGDYLITPDALMDCAVESDEWVNEISTLLTGTFDLLSVLSDNGDLNVSYNFITNIMTEYENVPLDTILLLSDINNAYDAFGGLESSLLVRASLLEIIDANLGSVSEDVFAGEYYLSLPETLQYDGLLNYGLIAELVHMFSNVIKEGISIYDPSLNTIGSLLQANSEMVLSDYLDIYNGLQEETFQLVGTNPVIFEFISETLMAYSFQSYARNTLQNMFYDMDLDIELSEDFLKFSREYNRLASDEVTGMLLILKNLRLTGEIIEYPDDHLLPHLIHIENVWDEIFNSEINDRLIREIFDFVLRDEGILRFITASADESISTTVNQLVETDAGINIDSIRPVLDDIVNISDENGHFDLTEIYNFLRAFNTLELTTFGEFDNFNDVLFIHEKIKNTLFIETLFESETIRDNTNKYFGGDSSMNSLGRSISEIMNESFGLDVNILGSDLSLAAEKYQIFDHSSGKPDIIVSEVKQLILSMTRYDWMNELTELDFSDLTSANHLVDILLSEKNSVSELDYILESRIIMAVFDKILNINASPSLSDAFIKFVNYNLNDMEGLSDLTLDSSILTIHGDVYNEYGVLDSEEIVTIVNTVDMFDFESEIDFKFFYNFVLDDTFESLFDSRILHSILSNVLRNDNIIDFAHESINDMQDFMHISKDILTLEDDVFLKSDINLIDPKEISKVLTAMNTLNLTTAEALENLGFDMINELTKDQIEDIFDANILYILIDKLLKDEQLGEKAAEMLGEALDLDIDRINMAPDELLLGTDLSGDQEVENGRILKSELCAAVRSLQILELPNQPESDTIKLSLLTDLVEPDSTKYWEFIEANYIYILLDRAFKSETLGRFTARLASDMLDVEKDYVDMTPPDDANYQAGRFKGYIEKEEIERMIVSFHTLGYEDIPTADDVDLLEIYAMIDLDNDCDFDKVIASVYFRHIMTKALLSDVLKDKIGDGRINIDDLLIPDSAYHNNDPETRRFTAFEIKKMFLALEKIGVTDINNIEVNISSISNLADDEIFLKGALGFESDRGLLSSDYIFAFIDLIIKTDLIVPLDSLNLSNERFREGYIYEREIISILNVLNKISGAEVSSIDASEFKVSLLSDLIIYPNPNYELPNTLGSPMVDRLLSDVIADVLTSPVPTRVYNLSDSESPSYRITHDELEKLVAAINLLTLGNNSMTFNELLAGLDETIQSRDTLQNIFDTDSRIIERLISKVIFDVFNEENDIPDASYYHESDADYDISGISFDLTRFEIQNIIDILDILGFDRLDGVEESSSEIENATTGAFRELVELGSPFVRRRITEALNKLDAIDVPDASYENSDKLDILENELYNLLYALETLSGGDDSIPISDTDSNAEMLAISDISSIIKPADEYSPINIRIVSTALIDVNIALAGDLAFEPDSTKDLKGNEIEMFIEKIAVIFPDINRINEIKENINWYKILMLTDEDLKDLIGYDKGEEEETMWSDYISRLTPIPIEGANKKEQIKDLLS